MQKKPINKPNQIEQKYISQCKIQENTSSFPMESKLN